MLSGEFTAQWPRFGKQIEESLGKHMLAGTPPKLIPSRDGSLSRLRGAAALVLQREAALKKAPAEIGEPNKTTPRKP